MADINSVTIVGRLTRDSELRITPNGTAIAKLSIAVNRRVKRMDQWEDDVSFFDATFWGKQAEGLNQYLLKGKQIAVQGELRQNRWKNDAGENRSKVEIRAINIQLLGGRREDSGDGATMAKPPVSTQAPSDDEPYEDDVPF